MRWWVGIAGLVVAASSPIALGAGSLRCGTELISEGQYAFEVLERCGEPLYERTHVEYRGFDVGPFWAVPVQVDEWVYDLGNVRFRRLLRFEDGRLMRIETLDRH